MNDCVRFVLARITEREATALAATPGPWKATEFYINAGSVDSEAPLDVLPLRDETWDEWQRRNIANESATGDIRMEDANHIAYWNPLRVLAECETHKEIVELHHKEFDPEDGIERCRLDAQPYPCATLYALAMLDADHSDYREEWKP
jgi:hypothetical protein